MKYNVGDKVRIKSLDWYNKKVNEYDEVICGCTVFVPDMTKYCGKIVTITKAFPYSTIIGEDNRDYYRIKEDFEIYNWTDEMFDECMEDEIKTLGSLYLNLNDLNNMKQEIKITEGYQFVDENGNVINTTKIVLEKKCENTETKDMGEVSDGYHTFNELYEYRLLYNAALFNEFAKQGLYDVHKSRKHSDGKYPFEDSNWFIVMAELPTGQISNHYEIKDWDKFQIPEKDKANKWDGHSPRDIADRLTVFTKPKKQYPKTYEECCKVLGCKADIFFTDFSYNNRDVEISDYEDKIDDLLQNFRKLRYCRDAYWMIAGDWEPDYNNGCDTKYIITTAENKNFKDVSEVFNYFLIFPTKEMRDAFYENFKDLIEECKELL